MRASLKRHVKLKYVAKEPRKRYNSAILKGLIGPVAVLSITRKGNNERMSRVQSAQRERLHEAIHTHDFLHRVMRQIEHLHRVVFHEQCKKLELSFIRDSAEEILIADLLSRHQGNIDGVYFYLRKLEDSGKSWAQAIAEYAAYVHNYYTTPLGVIMRRDLFGDDCHFVTPAAGKYAGVKAEKEKRMEVAAV